MKKLIRQVFHLILTLAILSQSYAFASPVKAKNDYSNLTYKELKIEYDKAVKENDFEKQEILVELGNKHLEREASKINSLISPLANPPDPEIDRIFNEHFYSAKWAYKYVDEIGGFGYALSLKPRPIVYGVWDTNASWNAILYKYGPHPYWAFKNVNVMKQQYVCHINLAPAKPEWNLEVDRTSIHPFTCN